MIEIPIEMSVQGNILIVVHHIKAVPAKSTAMVSTGLLII